MKAIVTGGAGFIGSHIVDLLLKNKHEVVVLDNFSTGRVGNLCHVIDQIELIECDLSVNGEWVDQLVQVDWVFHLAALADIVPSIKDPGTYFQSNVLGTFNIVQASHLMGVKRFIYAASSSGYGIPETYPTPEDSPIQPQYPYALTKHMGEEIVRHWQHVYKLPSLCLRLFNVYGTRSRTSGTYGAVLGVFLAQKLAGLPFTIVGDGVQTRDFTFVTDVASAFLMAAESNNSGQVYNVGSGQTVSVNKLADLLQGPRIYIPKRPGEPDCTFADIRRIQSEIGWSPIVTIEEGINLVLDQIDYWSEAPVWTPESIAEITRDWFVALSKNS